MTREVLTEFLLKHRLVFGLLADGSGNVLARAGDFDDPGFHSLGRVSPSWIPTTPGQILYMIEWLNGKLLPHMAAQGDAPVLLMRPLGTFFAAFGVRSSVGDVTWAYRHSRVVSSSLETDLLKELSA